MKKGNCRHTQGLPDWQKMGKCINQLVGKTSARKCVQTIWMVQIVIGSDNLTYHEDPGLPATSLLETNILINGVISYAYEGAHFMLLDLKDHFLTTPLHVQNS